ncbi:MAG: hypothetical protein ABI670_10965 [Chloroflexota bacterium]
MADNQDKSEERSYRGYDTPGEDSIIKSTSDAVPSPSIKATDRDEAPDAFIGGRVNEKPGSANPALPETIGVETGATTTADLLRARESAEEERLRSQHADMYADQATGNEAGDTRGNNIPVGSSEDAKIYREREFGVPTEPSEMDLLGGRGINIPTEDDNGR